MEGIVYGIANLNFQQNLLELGNEYRIHNYSPTIGVAMASSPQMFQRLLNVSVENQCSAYHNSSSNPEAGDNSLQEADDDVDANADVSCSRVLARKRSLTFSERRQLPSRASKDNSLVGTKRRTIMKPTKRISSVHKDFNSLTPAQVMKIYMNKKLTNFKPSNLETIFEETSDNIDEESSTRGEYSMGGRKFRRAIAFQDCFATNKALIKKRRAKIKKVIGRRPALKKISLEEFIEKLNSSMEEKHIATDTPPSDDMDEGYCHLETPLSNIKTIISSSAVASQAPREQPLTASNKVQ